MNLKFLMPIFLFLMACGGGKPPVNQDKAANIKVKNEQLALSNEVSTVTRTTQKLEKVGRGLETYRNSAKPEALRECNLMAEDNRREIADLDVKIQNFPDQYKILLAPIIPDLNQCVACTKTASDSCVKTRASINKAIKELYPVQ